MSQELKYLFELGRIDVDAVTNWYAQNMGVNYLDFFPRHRCGDFGDVTPAERERNMRAIQYKQGAEITSRYPIEGGVLIITTMLFETVAVTVVTSVLDNGLPTTKQQHLERLAKIAKESHEDRGFDFLE